MEVLAKRVLQQPVEIQVGGRSVVNQDIEQRVEIRPEGDRFLRLLEILGDWYTKGKVLIFVQTQEGCDDLFRDLIKVCPFSRCHCFWMPLPHADQIIVRHAYCRAYRMCLCMCLDLLLI